MTKRIFIVLVTLFLFNGILFSQTVQAGISSSGTSIIISAKPDNVISGNYSAGNVTIIWPTSYSISIGNITSTTGGPWAVQGGVQTSGANTFVDIGWASGSVVAINWAGGSTNELFRAEINQTGSGTGTFTITNDVGGGWYFEVGGGDFTNYVDPFYAASVAGVPLPVELTTFEASLNSGVELYWETATEVNNYGFEIERDYRLTGIEYQDSSNWEKIGFVEGHGTTNSPKSYSFTDNNLPASEEVNYRLKQIDLDGTFAYSKIITVDISSITSVEETIPVEYSLSQNYPNPFNPTTTIKFGLPEHGFVNLIVFNILGEEVTQLVNEEMQAGYHTVSFGTSHIASGVYIYRLIANGKYSATKKMLLMK